MFMRRKNGNEIEIEKTKKKMINVRKTSGQHPEKSTQKNQQNFLKT